MNRPLVPHDDRRRRHARRRFTVAELEEMTAAGILLEDERIELDRRGGRADVAQGKST